MLTIALAAAALLQTAAAPAAAGVAARAIAADPPRDAVHPASTLAVEIISHGAVMNGALYRPGGVGPFPLVVLLHGLPGNEDNRDLAQSLRRAGWAVLTFHYRGTFGSEGRFSIDNVLDDTDAALAYIQAAGTAAAWNVDPARVVVAGHSMGGLAAVHSADKGARLATILLAPWDPSVLATLLRPMSLAERNASALARWSDTTHGRLTGASPADIAAAIVDHGERWPLASGATALATRPVLIVTATHDLPSSQAGTLKAALATAPGARVDAIELDSDHGFNDHRIALQAAVLDWLAALPGAP